jgi:L-galactono-1,4-lactone dehydrogenase
VSAHGTGACIPSVDQSVVALKVVTPGKGTLQLSNTEHPELFRLVRVGLGGLGIVTELTLQCVPNHKLVEKTWTATREEAKRNFGKWLRDYQHMRYMWIPYTDTVVVVASNPEGRERGWFSWLTGSGER